MLNKLFVSSKSSFFQAPLLVLFLCLTLGEPQNNFRGNRNRNNNRRPARQNNARQNNGFLRNGVTRNGSRDRRGTEVYPGCNGKVCLPEANLCAERQNKVGDSVPSTPESFVRVGSRETVRTQK